LIIRKLHLHVSFGIGNGIGSINGIPIFLALTPSGIYCDDSGYAKGPDGRKLNPIKEIITAEWIITSDEFLTPKETKHPKKVRPEAAVIARLTAVLITGRQLLKHLFQVIKDNPEWIYYMFTQGENPNFGSGPWNEG